MTGNTTQWQLHHTVGGLLIVVTLIAFNYMSFTMFQFLTQNLLHFYIESSQLCCLAAPQTQPRCIFEPKDTFTWAPWVTFRKMRYLGFSKRSSWGSCPWASGSLHLSPKDAVLLRELIAAHVAKTLLAFWGTQNFFPCSQQTTPWPYPQPHESIPRPPKLVVYNPLKYCPLIYALVFQLVSSFIHPTRFRRSIPSRSPDVTLSDGPAQSALVTLRQNKSRTS